jgi:hypothetical protein
MIQALGNNVAQAMTFNIALYQNDFGLSVNPPALSAPQGWAYLLTVSVSSVNGFSGPVQLTLTFPPGMWWQGWFPSTMTLTPSGSNYTYFDIAPGTNQPLGTYTFTITATGGNPSRTHIVTFTVTVTTPPSCSPNCGGGGGGSLDKGTLITMADGSRVTVQNVKVGDQLLGYDPATGKYAVSTVTAVKVVYATSLLVIDTGTCTPLRTDASPTEILWTKLPDGTMLWLPVTQLKVGDFLWTQSGWVPVLHITSVDTGTHIMYDITATVPYFANGILDPPHPS